MNISTKSTKRSPMHRARVLAIALTAAGVAVTIAGCSGNLHHTYGTFHSALDRGAGCAELFDQRSLFDDDETLAKIDRDLKRVGCTSPASTRTD